VVGIRTDITETKLATLKIEREREFLTNVIESLPSPFYVKDRQHRWIIVNAEMGRLFECDPRELIGRADTDMRSAEDAARTLEEDEQCFAEPGVHYYEDAYRYPDGTLRYKLKSKAAIRLTTGEQFLVGFSADIDALKKLESELREAEAVARQAEEFTRLMLDSIPTPVLVKDERGVYLLVNRATERLLGKSRSELVGRTDLDLLGHDAAAASRDADQQALDSHSPVVSDWPCTDSAGVSRWMIRVMTSTQMADRSRFLVTVMTDITDRKKAESEVEKARSFLEELINAFPMPISVKDRQHLWVMVNAAKAVLVGATPKEMIGRSDPDYYPADYAAEAWQEDEDLFATGVPIVKEQSVSTPGHSDRWVVRNKSLISLADGTQYVVGINVDVTERKRIAREAERQRDFLQYMVNALPSPFYVKDSRHRWVMANQAAVAVIAGAGVDMGSFLGKTDSDFRDAAAWVRAWEEDDLCFREPGVHGFEDSIVTDGNREIHFLKS
jgi:PAS domain S-box-containing protein